MISRNPEVQARLQEEVDRAFEEGAGEFPDYTVVQGLPYLDMVVHETLRLHSPAPTTFRYCTHHHHHQPSSSTINHNVLHPQVVHAGLHHPRHQHHPQEERRRDVQREGLPQGPPVSWTTWEAGLSPCPGTSPTPTTSTPTTSVRRRRRPAARESLPSPSSHSMNAAIGTDPPGTPSRPSGRVPAPAWG